MPSWADFMKELAEDETNAPPPPVSLLTDPP